MKLMTSRGGFEVMGRNYRNWFSVWPGFRLGFWVEFPSEWHEEGTGTIAIYPGWGRVYIHFPWFRTYQDHGQCEGPRFGFQFHSDILWLYHGNSTGGRDRSRTTIYMPWHWRHCVHEVRNEAGDWEPYVGSWQKDKKPDGRVKETYDYTYRLNSGEVQRRQATVYIERRTWSRFWLPWRKMRESISVDFSDEVGEETGSWKGGTVGCGYDLLSGESALQALRRMERNRKF